MKRRVLLLASVFAILTGCGGDDATNGPPVDSGAPADSTLLDSTVDGTSDEGLDTTGIDTTPDARVSEVEAGPACAPGDVGEPDGGFVTCGTTCVDLQNDPNNCGGCFLACDPGQTCAAGTCNDIAVSLDGLRWELPCIRDDATEPRVCVTNPKTTKTAKLKGSTTDIYDVTLRFRGVVEQETYIGGTHDGLFQTGGVPSDDGWNIYRMVVSSPAQTYYLNRGTGGLYYCQAVDYTKTVQMAGGGTITLVADPADGSNFEIKNRDQATGAPIVAPDVPPAPASFNGQFVQMDVISVVKSVPPGPDAGVDATDATSADATDATDASDATADSIDGG